MADEKPDRVTIASHAITIASPEQRESYIAQACGDDNELRRQVETLVAEKLQAGGQVDAAPRTAAGQASEPTGESQPEGRQQPISSIGSYRTPKRTASIVMVALLLLLLVAALGASMLAVREYQGKEQATKAQREALARQAKAEEAEAELKSKLHQWEAAWRTADRERNQALASADAARRSAREKDAVLTFLQKRLLSAGRPGDVSLPEAFWAGGQGKDVTLLQAANAAETQVAETFADQPLSEAAVREMLGLTYLGVGAADLAVKQYERALALREAFQGDDQAESAACRNQLAVALRLAGRATEASLLFDRHPNSTAHASSLAVRGATLLLENKPGDAELKLRECLTIRQKIQPEDWTTFETMSLLGEALLTQKKLAEAEPLLLSGYEGMKQREEQIPPQDRARLDRAIDRLVKLYESTGKTEEAMRWRKQLKSTQAS